MPGSDVVAFQPSFDDLSAPLFDVTFCVLDLETTGGSPANCEITEIGAVKYRGGELIGTFQTLVDPGLPIPP
ncbi:MAG TPA: exonuclease domain-containing protein, partial [Acidimicrobiia bacterium]